MDLALAWALRIDGKSDSRGGISHDTMSSGATVSTISQPAKKVSASSSVAA
jgi:hypothetical protein